MFIKLLNGLKTDKKKIKKGSKKFVRNKKSIYLCVPKSEEENTGI